jgi:chromosome segregation ATPase
MRLQEQINAYKTEHEHKDVQTVDLQKLVSHLRHQHEQQQQQHKQALEQQQHTQQDEQQQQQQKQQHYQQIQLQLHAGQQELVRVKQELAADKDKLQALQRELQDQQQQQQQHTQQHYQQLQLQLHAGQQELARVKQELADDKDKLQALQQELQDMQHEAQILRQEAALLRERAQSLASAHEQMREKLALTADGLSESMREASLGRRELEQASLTIMQVLTSACALPGLPACDVLGAGGEAPGSTPPAALCMPSPAMHCALVAEM